MCALEAADNPTQARALALLIKEWDLICDKPDGVANPVGEQFDNPDQRLQAREHSLVIGVVFLRQFRRENLVIRQADDVFLLGESASLDESAIASHQPQLCIFCKIQGVREILEEPLYRARS